MAICRVPGVRAPRVRLVQKSSQKRGDVVAGDRSALAPLAEGSSEPNTLAETSDLGHCDLTADSQRSSSHPMLIAWAPYEEPQTIRSRDSAGQDSRPNHFSKASGSDLISSDFRVTVLCYVLGFNLRYLDRRGGQRNAAVNRAGRSRFPGHTGNGRAGRRTRPPVHLPHPRHRNQQHPVHRGGDGSECGVRWRCPWLEK